VVLSEGGRLVAALGLSGVCVVDAGDALLVVPRDRAQDVRAVVEALKARGRGDKL
jgi:mannose-1-phosphate guanylyltransferase